MTIRLVAMDLDGTLVGPAMRVPARSRNALERAMANGCRVTIATGRAFPPTAHFARELGLNAPLLLCQGALIQDHRDGRILYTEAIPLDLARQVAAYARKQQLAVQVHLEDDNAYSDVSSPLAERMAAISGVPIITVANLLEWLPRPPLKFLFYVPREHIDGALRGLQTEFGGRLQVVQSWHSLVEVTNLSVSKGRALAWLAAQLDIDRAETMAIGDHDNDISMIEWAGLGIAMWHATRAAQAAANVIAPECPEPDPPMPRPDGRTFPRHDESVAWAVERYVLGEVMPATERPAGPPAP